jgi:O-antigen ligase
MMIAALPQPGCYSRRASPAEGLDRLAYMALWVLVLTLPWSETLPTLGELAIGRWLGLIAAGFGVLRLVMLGRGRPLTPLHYWMLAFVAWAGLSILWTVDWQGTLTRTGTYVQLLVVAWLIWELARTESRIAGLLLAYALGAFIAGISLIANYWQGLTAGSLSDSSGGSIWDQDRYTIAGSNGNDLGLTIAMGIPIIFYLLSRRKGAGWAMLLWVQLVCCFVAVLLTGSRGSLLATGVSLVMLPFMMFRLSPYQKAGTVLVCAAMLAVGIATIPEATLARLLSISDELQEGTLTHRTLIWAAGLDVFRDNPMVGVGSGAYGAAVLRAIDIPYVAHNTFLSVLVELGIIGGLLLLGLLASLVRAALRMSSTERSLWITLLLTWAVGVAALSWEYRKPTWFLFALIAAHAFAARRVEPERARVGTRLAARVPAMAASETNPLWQPEIS